MKINFGELYDYKWNVIPEFEYNISISFQGFRVMLEKQEQVWGEYRQSLLQSQSMQRDELDSGNTEFDEDLIMIDEVIQSQRVAQFLVLFSFLESRVKQLCSFIDKEFNFKIKPEDLSENGGYISKYIKYLNKVYGIDIIDLKPYLKQIDEYRKLRNILIHSRFSDNQKGAKGIKLLYFETQSFGLDAKYTITNIRFLTEYIKVNQGFLDALIRLCDMKYGDLVARVN